MAEAPTVNAPKPNQAFTSIVDSLQDPKLDPSAAMAGAKKSFTSAESFVQSTLQAPSQQLQGTVVSLKDNLISGLTPTSGTLPSLDSLTESLGPLPISAEDITVQVTQKIKDIGQALDPGDIAQKLRQSFPDDLGKSLVPDTENLLGKIQLPSDFLGPAQNMFGDFVTQLKDVTDDASALPLRLLDNVLNILKNFLARLKSTDWIEDLKLTLSQEFFAPLQQLKQRIPHIALREINREIQKREQIIRSYIAVLERYQLDKIQSQDADALRKQIRADRRQVRTWKLELGKSEQRIRELLQASPEFDLGEFTKNIETTLSNPVNAVAELDLIILSDSQAFPNKASRIQHSIYAKEVDASNKVYKVQIIKADKTLFKVEGQSGKADQTTFTLDTPLSEAIVNYGKLTDEESSTEKENSKKDIIARITSHIGYPQATLYQRIFGSVDALVTSFVDKFTEIVTQVEGAIDKVKDLLQGVIGKAEAVGEKISGVLEAKINDVKKTVESVQSFLDGKLNQVTAFVTQASDKLSASIIPFKTSVNQFTGKAVAKILELSQQIEAKTKAFEQSLKQVDNQINTKLNPTALQQQLEPILQQVDSVLRGQTVQDALNQADEGITAINDQLVKISLKPVFQKVKDKTTTLETDIEDYVKDENLSTAQKTAIKVGAKLIQQVDVPGQVKPELIDGFGEILSPVEDTISLVQAEVNKVDDIVNGFEPKSLVENALSGPIGSLVSKLDAYRPAVLFAPLASGFETVIDNLKSLDPEQIIEILHQVHQRLEDLISYLDPASFVQGLRDRMDEIIQKLPDTDKRTEWLEPIIGIVTDKLQDTQTLLQGLGVDDFINQANDGFLNGFQKIFDNQVSPKRIDEIKQQLSEFIPVEEYAQEMRSLALALEDFKNNPDGTATLAKNNLNQALLVYEGVVNQFKTQWQVFERNQTILLAGQTVEDGLQSVKTEALRSKMHLACQIAYDYLLVELSEKSVSGLSRSQESNNFLVRQGNPLNQYCTLNVIKELFAASKLLKLSGGSEFQVELDGEITIQESTAAATNGASKDKSATAEEKTPEKGSTALKSLLADLKNASKAESLWQTTFDFMDQQLFIPLKATLNKLATLWGSDGLKGLLAKIKGFFSYINLTGQADSTAKDESTFLGQVNQLIESVTADVTVNVGGFLTNLKDDLNNFATKVLGNKTSTTKGIIENIYDQIKAAVSQFDPYLILNSFYGVNDFYGGTLPFLQLLQAANLATDASDQKQQIARLILRHMKQIPQDVLKTVLPETVSDTAATLVEKHIVRRTPESDQYLMMLTNLLLSSPQINESFRNDLKRQGIEFPEWFTPEVTKLDADIQKMSDGEDRDLKILRYNRLCLEAVFSQEISMGIQSVFPFFLYQLRKLYPKALEERVGEIYQSILDVIASFPSVVADAVQALYDKVKEAYQPISALKDKFFEVLLAQLYRLQTELEMGLDDLGQDYNHLLDVMGGAA